MWAIGARVCDPQGEIHHRQSTRHGRRQITVSFRQLFKDRTSDALKDWEILRTITVDIQN